MSTARLLPAIVAALPALSAAQTIFSVSERAGPGATISVVGDSLIDSTRYTVTPIGASGVRGTAQTVSASSTSGSVALLTLPSTLATSMYEVVAKTGSTVGNAVYVNRPRTEWLDVSSAMPGQIVRVSGRTFRPFGSVAPKVNLVNARNVSYPAVVERGTDSMIRFRVGTTTPAGSYTVRVTSALGSDVNALPLTVLASRTDPLGVGTAWGADIASTVYVAKTDARLPAHPVGNGVAEDGAAIGLDLYWISTHGGGILQLEAATYRIDKGTDDIALASGTCLRGAGMGKTTLQMGYVSTPDYHSPLRFQGENAAPEGMMDLTVQNLDVSGAPNRVLQAISGNPRKAFLKRVEFQMNNAHDINLFNARDMVIEGCRFVATSMAYPALSMENAQNLRYVGNTDYHRTGRLRILYSDRAVIEGSNVQFDNAYRNATTGETGTLDVSFDQRLLVSNCDLGALGGMPNRGGVDGEVILDQFAVTNDLLYTGAVASSTGARIVATQSINCANWTDPGKPSPTGRMEVYIIAGKGMGQHRLATAWNGAVVDVESPWTVSPDSTSRFAISPRLAYQQTIEGSRLKGGFYGIELEHGALDCTVQGNTLTDTGAILLLGYVQFSGPGYEYGAAGSSVSFSAGWNNAILDNQSNDLIDNGRTRAAISLSAFTETDSDPGPLLLGNDVRGNTIRGCGGLPTGGEYGGIDGLEIIAIHRNRNNSPNSILQQGTILQDNSISNSSMPLRNYNVGVGGGFLDNLGSLLGL